MKTILKNKLKNTFSTIVCPFLPKDRSSCVVTIHDLKKSEFPWFEKLIDELLKDWRICTFEEVVQNKKGCLHFSFDDAFHSTYEVINKYLLPRQMTATIFVPTSFVGLNLEESREFARDHFYKISRKGYLDMSRAMTWEELAHLLESGCSIGAHTKDHISLKNKEEALYLEQIVGGVEILGKKLKASIDTFAYPFGSSQDIDRESASIVKKNFEYAFTNIRGNVSESYDESLIFRQNLTALTPYREVRSILFGKYNFFHNEQRRHCQIIGKEL